MKEDILEQMLDEYLMHLGYFTTHNVKFKPRRDCDGWDQRQDSVASDIDVIGIHPTLQGPARVIVVSCKSWQTGFDPSSKVAEIEGNKIISGREAWRGFRELVQPKWAKAFIDAVENCTGTRQFEYWTAVTLLKREHSRDVWEKNPVFIERLEGNTIHLKTFRDMLDAVWRQLATTPAASEIGRLIQLIKASGWTPPN